MNALFSNGAFVNPAHPSCRCAVAYEEVIEPIVLTVYDEDTGKLWEPEVEITANLDGNATDNLSFVTDRGIINPGANEDGKGNLGIADTREMAGGLRKSPFHILTDAEIEMLKKDIEAIQADISIFSFNKGRRTSYNDEYDEIRVRGDVLPNPNSTHPRDLMSTRAVLAHEYYGHRQYRNTTRPLPYGSWNDEFRASYMAAKNAPGLVDDDKRLLVLDALERAKNAGISITYNSFIKEILYGY